MKIPAPTSPRLALALEFLLYALLTAFALHATWLTWPDAFIDFSRELYLPWRVARGDILYRDLAYDFGPVSVYTNAALFALLGRPSIHALFALNFAFWIATLLALRALLRRIASPLASTLAVSSFVLLFSFNRYLDVGNYNFLAPYTHELPRGLLLALLALLSLDSALEKSSCRFSSLSGFLLGLSLFTKPEIALAAVASFTALFCLRLVLSLHPSRVSRRSLLARRLSLLLCGVGGVFAALAGVAAPFALAFASLSGALHGTLLKLYLDCLDPSLAAIPFYKVIMGTDAIPAHVLRLLVGTVLAASPFLFVRFALPRLHARPRLVVSVILAFACAAMGWGAFFSLNAALPLAPVLFALSTLRDSANLGNAASCRVLPGRGRPAGDGEPGVPSPPETRTPEPELRPHLPLALAFAVFALALVFKIVLNCGIGHYGFVLALPAFCCAVLLLFRSPRPPRAAIGAALLLGFAVRALSLQSDTIHGCDIRHPVNGTSFLASAHDAQAFNAALDWIRANTLPGSTLAVLPEGAILNVFSERTNPTPFVYLSQGDWLRFNSDAVLSAYSNAPPDTLVLLRKLEPVQFGIDYAQSLMAVLDPLYAPALTLTLSTPFGTVPYLLVATRIPSP